MKTGSKKMARQKRHRHIRRKLIGTPDSPRMCVFHSLRYIYVQIIDDLKGNTISACTTLSKEFRERFPGQKNNKQAAAFLGELMAEKALKKGIKKVVFDRGGYKYQGRVQALAEAARKKGLGF